MDIINISVFCLLAPPRGVCYYRERDSFNRTLSTQMLQNFTGKHF